ncbi:TPA: hypothetical protein HA241_03040 [Candidatus Woesearchaeota archaeon]|nr:hypothetical protein [Candidatus Woesearchaeota archaeon]
MGLLEGKALVFGSRNRILAFHEGMKKPVCLATREGSDGDNEVTALILYERSLFDTNSLGAVYQTLTGQRVDGRRTEIPVYKLVEFQGELFGVEGTSYPKPAAARCPLEERSRPASPDGEEENRDQARIFRVADDSTLHTFNDGRRGLSQGPLSLRPNSLDLAVAGDDLYLASENVVHINGTSVTALTSYTSDSVQLASDGKLVVASTYHNSETFPKGAEVRLMPDNKLLAFWDCKRFGSPGYHGRVALHDDVIVFGSGVKKKENNPLYGFRITPEMHDAPGGIGVTPELVLANAFERPSMYGSGNPLLIVSRDELEHLLATRK